MSADGSAGVAVEPGEELDARTLVVVSGVVALAVNGGTELDGRLEEAAALAHRLEEPGRSSSVGRVHAHQSVRVPQARSRRRGPRCPPHRQ